MAVLSIPRSWLPIALALCLFPLALGADGRNAWGQCVISGPTQVDANQSFVLCGPSGSGYRYQWYGPGLTSGQTSRCMSVGGRGSGTYEYLLVIRVNGQEIDRCNYVVNVGGATGGVGSCTISGPTVVESGTSARLCAVEQLAHSYRWSGPNGFTATSACVTVNDEGTYYLTTRNLITGSTRTCTHQVDFQGTQGTVTQNCDISGPDVIPQGETARLCGPYGNDLTYRWTGPNGFTASGRCVSVSRLGTYRLMIRDQSSGQTDVCTHLLSYDTGNQDNQNDADNPVSDNCPRGIGFWRQQCTGQSVGNPRDLSTSEMRQIAATIDRESSYFNWSNDLDGLCQAVGSPGTELEFAL